MKCPAKTWTINLARFIIQYIYTSLSWNEAQSLALMYYIYILCIRTINWKLLLSNFENFYSRRKRHAFEISDQGKSHAFARWRICEQNYSALDIRSVCRRIALSRSLTDGSLLWKKNTVPVHISPDVRRDVRDPFLETDKNTRRLKGRSWRRSYVAFSSLLNPFTYFIRPIPQILFERTLKSIILKLREHSFFVFFSLTNQVCYLYE